MWILDHKRDTLYRVSDRVFSLSKDEALGSIVQYGSVQCTSTVQYPSIPVPHRAHTAAQQAH